MKKITESNNVSHNQLIHEKSPYLLQHAYNPVNWYSWCDEAFDKAINEDKPIFLSIGYATCHWCHVMAHESFEDDEVAQLLNDNFISIKVDREERPDIDNVYMSVCQSLTGSGGWPLSVFMTPQSKPFYAGTYFPKSNRMGMVGFTDILTQISKLWRAERTRIIESADEITNFLAKRLRPDEKQVALDEGTLKDTYEQLLTNFDSRYGGFGRAPKFPTPHNLSFLLRWANRHNDSKSLEIVQKTLKSMRNGGIFDHIGFGFHRYSVDERWFAPHFEKMLYDQALLSIAYIEAFQKTGDELHAQTAHEIFTYVLRDMTFSEGGFYSAEDADSEGEEGKFYLWTQDEIYNHLGKDVGELFCRYFNITQKGNFEKGRNIPHSLIDDHTFAEKEGMDIQELIRTINNARQKLFEIRKTRVHPLKDDKILTAWNGLMIAALAKGYQVLGEQSYIDSATNAADFIVQYLTKHDGTLLRRYRDGDVAYSGYLNDYAFFVWGLIELYEATFNIAYLEEALKINHVMISNFWDNEDKGLFFSGTDNEKLIFSNKEIYDGAIPSGNSVAALNFLRLGRLTGDTNLDEKVDELIRGFSSQIKSHPMAYTHFMSALDFAVGPVVEIIIAGNPSDEILNRMIKKIRTPFLPNKVLLMNPDNQKNSRLVNLLPDIENMKSIESQPTVYLCEGYACKSPITSIEGLQIAIDQLTLKNN